MKKVTLKKVHAYKLLASCLSYRDAEACGKLVEAVGPRRAAKAMNNIEDRIREAILEYAKEVDRIQVECLTDIQAELNALPEDKREAAVPAMNAKLSDAINGKAALIGLDKQATEDVEFELSDENHDFLNKALDKMCAAITDRGVYNAICTGVEEAK